MPHSPRHPNAFRDGTTIGALAVARSLVLPPALALALALTLTLTELGYGSSCTGDRDRHSHADVSLISFGSVHGEVIGQSARGGLKGGVELRAAYVDSLRSAGVPFLHLDLGNFASNRTHVGEMTAEFLWDCMKRMGVDACNVGPRELELGAFLQELIDEESIPLLASNLTCVRAGREEPLAREYLIFERNDVRIALLGLMGRTQLEEAELSSGFPIRLADPVERARKLVPELRRQAEVVVLLSQMSTPETDRLLKEVEGIDVALYGNLPPWVERSTRVANTLVNQTGTRGHYIGHLVIIVGPDGRIVDSGSKNAPVFTYATDSESELSKRVSDFMEREKEVRRVAREAGR